MTDVTSIPSPDDGMGYVRRLLHTALYDTGTYIEEEGYWPHTARYSASAARELAQRFRDGAFGEAQLSALREAVTAPEAPLFTVEYLLAQLGALAAPLIPSLLADANPIRRAAGVRLASAALAPEAWLPALADLDPWVRTTAVRLASAALAPEVWLPALADPDPSVRITAVNLLITAHRLPADSPYKPPDYQALVRRALGDPDADVRLAAAASTKVYADKQRNALLAQLSEREADPLRRRILTDHMIQAAEQKEGFADPLVRATLLQCLSDDHVGIRWYSVHLLVHRVFHASAEEDLTDVCIALFEQLLVEQDSRVRMRLTEGASYVRITDYVIARLTALLPDNLPSHFGLAYFLRQFGESSVPLLTHLAAQPGPGAISTQAKLSLAAIGATVA